MAGQHEVGEFWACSLLDFYGWKSAPVAPDAPPLAEHRARMYYNSDDNTIHVIDSTGAELLTGGGGAVSSVFGRTGIVVASPGDYSVAQITGAAPLASPAFTGIPSAPTAAGGTNTTQIATTEFVQSAVSGGAVIAMPIAGTASPVPVYSPSEAPPNVNPSFFIQDINGAWHQQAGIDTTTADDGTGFGPPDPAGTLTWFKRSYFRDSMRSTQVGKNAFISINHTSGIGTSQNNQDRSLWINAGNPSINAQSFSITSNVVAFGVGTYTDPNGAGYVMTPGMVIQASGLSTGTYLNGVPLTIISVSPSQITASSSGFTHADVGSTADTGSLDQKLYSLVCAQMELDIAGSPNIDGSPDGEANTLSLQFSDNHIGSLAQPALGAGCIRATYFREIGAGMWSGVNASIRLYVENNSTVNGGSQYIANLQLFGTDNMSCAGLGYVALEIDPPSPRFQLENYGIYIKNFGSNTNDYAIYSGGGQIFLGGPTTFGSPIQPATYTVAALPAGAEGQTAYATNGRKVGEPSGAGTGVPVYFSNTAWRVYSTDAPVAS